MPNPMLEEIFEYHAPTAEQVERMDAIRRAAKGLALAIDENCPPSADRTAAMRDLQTAVHTANRAIVFHGISYK